MEQIKNKFQASQKFLIFGFLGIVFSWMLYGCKAGDNDPNSSGSTIPIVSTGPEVPTTPQNFFDIPAADDAGGVPTTPFLIRSVNAEAACIQAVNDSNANFMLAAPGNNLAVDTCGRPSPQVFNFIASALNPAVGALTIYGGTYCLDVGPTPADGGNVVTWVCNGSPSQQFTVTSSREIKDYSGKCVTLTGANVTSYSSNAGGSARLKLYGCGATVDQKWTLDPGPSFYKASTLTVDLSQTTHICQLVGEFDRRTGVANSNHSESRYGIPGTDLGTPVLHNGKLFFIFGDTFYSSNPPQYKVGPVMKNANRNFDADSIAYTTTSNPDACLDLTWNADTDGLFKPITVPGEHLNGTEVPSAGFSANNVLYVLFATDNNYGGVYGMTRSFMGKSLDDGMTYSKLYDMSKDPRANGTTNAGRFINGAADVVSTSEVHGLPVASQEAVALFGTGAFRVSNPYLAVIPGDSVESKASIKYFTGVDANNRPRWSSIESDAQPIFESVASDQRLGEISAAYDSTMGKWVLMYTGWNPPGVLMRIADHPWGPWSPAVSVFNPYTNNAFQSFMSGGCVGGLHLEDARLDPIPSQCGITYGPAFIKKYTKSLGNGQYQIYFDLSTWVPYAVHLMTAKISVQ